MKSHIKKNKIEITYHVFLIKKRKENLIKILDSLFKILMVITHFLKLK